MQAPPLTKNTTPPYKIRLVIMAVRERQVCAEGTAQTWICKHCPGEHQAVSHERLQFIDKSVLVERISL